MTEDLRTLDALGGRRILYIYIERDVDFGQPLDYVLAEPARIRV